MKTKVLLFLLCFTSSLLHAQELSVSDFKKVADATTSSPCFSELKDEIQEHALLKVKHPYSDFYFEVNRQLFDFIEDPCAAHPTETWILLPAGTEDITIHHSVLGFLSNYIFPISLQARNVYELTLTSDVEVPREWTYEGRWMIVDSLITDFNQRHEFTPEAKKQISDFINHKVPFGNYRTNIRKTLSRSTSPLPYFTCDTTYQKRHAIAEEMNNPARQRMKPQEQEKVDSALCYPGGMKGILQHISRSTIYPLMAQEEEIVGVVKVQVQINEEGYVSKFCIEEHLTPECDLSAVYTFSQLRRFTPAMRDGKAVPYWITLPLRFNIY